MIILLYNDPDRGIVSGNTFLPYRVISESNLKNLPDLIRNTFIVNITAIHLLDEFHHTDSDRQYHHFVHRLQDNLDAHHQQQLLPSNNPFKGNGKEDQRIARLAYYR